MGNILKKKAKIDGPKSRMVVPNIFVPGENDPAMCPNKDYPNNKIKTTKYTIWTFLPKNLFEQFHRFANIFFLFLVILNWIPELNVFLKEISMFPLIFVLSVTGVKDAYEDFRRYQSDKKVNNLKCKLFSAETGKYENARWQDLKVGDIVHLTCNETIPADLLVLHSSDLSGMCYIETSNIDGENNLKQREVVRGMQGNDCFDPLEFKSSVVCEIPNAHIYQFNGSVNQPNGEQKAINKTNLVLRGCIIRNTDYVEGVLVYTGHETKALLNNRGPGFKRSKLERQVNKDIMWCIVLLIILCFTGAIGGAVWLNQFEENENILYIQFESAEKYNPAYQAFISFWIYLIMLQVIIPMPMYITIEISKMIQVILINQDMDLFHHASNTRIECRALNITEDLGQIQYVFSDKTGTLTENRMVFRCCNIGGFDYTSFPDDEDEPFDQSDEKVDSGQLKLDQQLQYEIDNMNSKKLGSSELSEQSQHIQDFFLLMAICNTVVVSAKPHGEKYAEDEAIPVQKCVISDDDLDAGWSSKLPHRRRKKKRQKRHHTHKTRKVSHVDDSAVDMSGQSDDALMKNFAEVDSDPVSELNNRFLKKSGSLKSHQRDPKHRKTPKSGVLNIGYENKDFSHEDTSEKEILTEPKVTEITLCYEAESPDELALVKAAYRYGCRLLRRTVDTVTVWFPSEGEVTLKIHHVLPFDSERKRMSVIIQYPNSSDYVVYTKGADSSVISNLACVKGNLKDEAMIKHVELHLDASSKQGLRTLCMAKKTLKPEEYGMWLQMYRQAELGPFEHKEMALFDAACHLETDLELLGASGIEDNLQDGVPETIAKLRKAGINVWVLTGDKKETALNIAYSCKLIDPEHNIIMLSATRKENAEKVIDRELERLRKMNRRIEVRQRHRRPAVRKDVALVVDGTMLAFVFDEDLKIDRKFLAIAEQCYSVVCCRTTPSQKAKVVKLVKDNLRMTTLAIGDGANDVNMIHSADIGVGISGQEGMQAVMASDFSIARFRFLEKLLLVHGHWCYDRLARMCLYMFYKNAMYVFMIFWFQLYNGFSAFSSLDQFYQVFFNLFFTSLPPIIMGGFDQSVTASTLISRPQLYKDAQKCRSYLPFSFWLNIIDALYQSLVIFYIPYLAYKDSDIDIWSLGTIHITLCVLLATGQIGIEIKAWSWLFVLFMAMNLIIFYGFMTIFGVAVVTQDPPANPYWVFYVVYSTPLFWCVLVLAFIIALIPRMAVRALKATIVPSFTTYARNVELLDPSMGSQWFQKSNVSIAPSVNSMHSTSQPISIGTVNPRKRKQSMTMAVMRHVSHSLPSLHHHHAGKDNSKKSYLGQPNAFQTHFMVPYNISSNVSLEKSPNKSRHRRYPSMPLDLKSLTSSINTNELSFQRVGNDSHACTDDSTLITSREKSTDIDVCQFASLNTENEFPPGQIAQNTIDIQDLEAADEKSNADSLVGKESNLDAGEILGTDSHHKTLPSAYQDGTVNKLVFGIDEVFDSQQLHKLYAGALALEESENGSSSSVSSAMGNTTFKGNQVVSSVATADSGLWTTHGGVPRTVSSTTGSIISESVPEHDDSGHFIDIPERSTDSNNESRRSSQQCLLDVNYSIPSDHDRAPPNVDI